MKKIYTILFGLFCANILLAQQAAPPVISTLTLQEPSSEINLTATPIVHEKSNTGANRAAPRWYSMVDAVDQSQGGTGAIYSNASFNTIWHDSTINLPYSDGVGIVYEPVWVRSISTVLDPTDDIFNSPFAYPGEALVTPMDPYTLDSVNIFGIYTRNPSKLSIVDTLVVTIIRGDGTGTMSDLDIRFWGPGTTTTNHNTDTLRFMHGFLELNPASPDAFTWIASSPANKFDVKIPLTAVTANDTLSNGFNYFSIPVNLSVPPGNKLDMSVTFKSGDTWIPLVDTVYESGSFSTPNFNNFRFTSFEEAAGSYQTYTKGYYNASNLMRTDSSGWSNWHIPSYAFTNASYAYEHHWFEWKLNCASCNIVGPTSVNNFENEVELKVYPNPVNDLLTIDMNLKESVKSAQIDLMSTSGQVIKSINLGPLASTAQHSTLDVSNIAKGMYILHLSLDGQKIVKKLNIQ